MKAEHDANISRYSTWAWGWATAICTGGFFHIAGRKVVSVEITTKHWRSKVVGVTRDHSKFQLSRCIRIKKSGVIDNG